MKPVQQQQFSEIVSMIRQSQYNAIKTVNTELINLYWNVGNYISKQLASTTWGDRTVEELAAFIHKEYPEIKGFNRRGLYRMKQFYETYVSTSLLMKHFQVKDNETDKIVSSSMTQFIFQDIRGSILSKISWTHHLVLMSRTKTDEEREFYLQLAIKEKYTVRELERQISSGIFERTMIGHTTLSTELRKTHPSVTNSFRDNYVFEFLGLSEFHNEQELQKGLIGKMKDFILELGKDFLFVGEEYRIQVGNSDFYIDLLFYHRGLQCLIAFELKADKFKPEQLGQLNFYLEALDRDVKKSNENPSIGILLCKDKDVEVVEYALSRYLSPTMVSEYQTQLPDKKVLQRKLQELFDE